MKTSSNIFSAWKALALCSLVGLFGCGEEEPEFTFDRADMEAEVLGTWSGTWEGSATATIPLTLEIRGRDEPSRSPACASRKFSAEGHAPSSSLQCMGTSSLALSATLSLADGSSPAELDGSFFVMGRILGGGDLTLEYRGLSQVLMAERHDGGWSTCSVLDSEAANRTALGSCTLDTRAE